MKYRPQRYLTQYPIDLHTPTGVQRAQVLDVNSTGARLEGVKELRRGDKLRISILSEKADAVVQWSFGSRIGVAFRTHLTDQQVDILRYRRDARATAGRGRVGFHFTEMR